MNHVVVALVLISCFMHAGWNLLARHESSETKFIGHMLRVTILVGMFPAFASELIARSLDANAWFCVIGSGICCGMYYFSLASAYSLADFTVVYPVARSMPILFVALGDIVRGRWVTPIGWLGMVLVVAGCFLAPLHSFRDFRMRRYVNRAVLWMLLTALGTVGYTLLDKVASETVKPGPATAARYGYFFTLIAYGVYSVLVKTIRTDELNSGVIGWRRWRLPALAAAFNFGAYWLVLWAYQLSQHAGYIVAFRQFSVVLGVAIAFLIYKEKGAAVRLTATFLISFGLLLVSMWGA
jgi:drug/metabolite transporter (DMT)-like permease